VKGGISGNLTIAGGLDKGGALVSGGEIGDAALGTKLNLSGDNKGIVAAKGKVRFGIQPTVRGVFLQNVGVIAGNSDALAIDAIFTDNHTSLGFDLTGLDLGGLGSILRDLRSLRATAGGHLIGTTA
jgi:hypothetical protein